MGRYISLWEVDHSRLPANPEEIASGWSILANMVKEDMKKGIIKDWGAFVGETNGYSIAEGTEVEIGKLNVRYAPFVSFKVYAVASLREVEQIIKSMSK
jgi:hypothetical protein